MSETKKALILLLILLVGLGAWGGYAIWADYREEKEYEKYCAEKKAYWDSIYAIEDTIQVIENNISTNEEYDNNMTSGETYSGSGNSNVGPAHSYSSGTRPDDGMYGFDPLDDRDDAYNLDHFQQDAYPDDDY